MGIVRYGKKFYSRSKLYVAVAVILCGVFFQPAVGSASLAAADQTVDNVCGEVEEVLSGPGWGDRALDAANPLPEVWGAGKAIVNPIDTAKDGASRALDNFGDQLRFKTLAAAGQFIFGMDEKVLKNHLELVHGSVTNETPEVYDKAFECQNQYREYFETEGYDQKEGFSFRAKKSNGITLTAASAYADVDLERNAWSLIGQLFGYQRSNELSGNPELVTEVVLPINALFYPASLGLALIGLMWQCARLIVSQKSEGLTIVIKSLVTIMFVHGLGTVAAMIAARAADAYTNYIGDVLGETVSIFDIWQGMAVGFMSVSWAWMLALILFPFLYLAALIFQLMLLMRQVLVVFMIGLLPFAASGLMLKSTRGWLLRLVGAIIGVYLFKPAAASSVAFIFMMIASSSFTMTIIGVILLCFLPFTLPKVMKLFSFAGVNGDNTANNMFKRFLSDAAEYKSQTAAGGGGGGSGSPSNLGLTGQGPKLPGGGGGASVNKLQGSKLAGKVAGLTAQGAAAFFSAGSSVAAQGAAKAAASGGKAAQIASKAQQIQQSAKGQKALSIAKSIPSYANPLNSGNVDAKTFVAGTAATGIADGVGDAANTGKDFNEDFVMRDM